MDAGEKCGVSAESDLGLGSGRCGYPLCPNLRLPLLMLSAAMGYLCFEGDCANKPDWKPWTTQARLHQHQYKMHTDTREEETSMGRVLNLKREHDADVEEARKRQLLEVEMAHRTPEPEPPCPVRSIIHPVDVTLNTILRQSKCRYLSWTDQLMLSSPGRQENDSSLHDSGTTFRPQQPQPRWVACSSPKSGSWKQ